MNDLLEKLNANLDRYTIQFEEINADPQFRNIAFGSAGYLSKASKNRLAAFRNRLGKITDKIALTKLCIKLVTGETFTYGDVRKIYYDFLAIRNPEMESYFLTECFPLCKVREMLTLIFDIHNVAYRKSVLRYNMKYTNTSGCTMDIPLTTAA